MVVGDVVSRFHKIMLDEVDLANPPKNADSVPMESALILWEEWDSPYGGDSGKTHCVTRWRIDEKNTSWWVSL